MESRREVPPQALDLGHRHRHHRHTRRAAAIATLAPTASASTSSPTAASRTIAAAAKHHEPKPTVVLIHGGFADASNWNGVIKLLEKQGYPVMAPANPLRGIPYDASYIRSVLASVKGPIILVGHSYGGAVITNAASGNPNVKATRTSWRT